MNAVGDFPNSNLSVIANPTGNSAATGTTLNIQGDTVAADKREFLVNFGLTSSTGSKSRPSPYHDKVCLSPGIVATKGTGDVWARNPLVTRVPRSGQFDAQGIELDVNNLNAHRGDADAGSGLAPSVTYGMSVSGAGDFRSTSGYLLSGPGKPIWNRGITFANDCVAQSTFQDLGNPEKSIDIRGNPTYGIYQSSKSSKNYFAGGTTVASSLTVKGDILVTGRVRQMASSSATTAASEKSTRNQCLRMLETGMPQRGNVQLNQAGEANVTVTAIMTLIKKSAPGRMLSV
jgi:hypothetical protein